jgi:hypothetical protein
MSLNHSELIDQVLALLRQIISFKKYAITLPAVVVYIYINEIKQKNGKRVAAGLAGVNVISLVLFAGVLQ